MKCISSNLLSLIILDYLFLQLNSDISPFDGFFTL